MATGEIVYPMVPSRFSMEVWDKILNFIREKGCIPFDHRRGASFEDFELKLGREKTLNFLINIMKQCDAVWVFGISEGVMGEFKVALEMRRAGSDIEIRGFYNFDPDWEKYYEEFKPKYGDLVAELRGMNRLIALVGPRAVGKTFWTDYLLLLDSADCLGRVKNTPTRKPRDEKDHLTYDFLSVRKFRKGIKEGKFLEYDRYKGNYYGSSMDSIKDELDKRNGIFAITPAGAEKLYAERFGMNLSIILLQAEESVMRRNFVSRGITDEAEQNKLLKEARRFVLPEHISHQVIKLTGVMNIDREKMISAIFSKS